MIHLLFTVIFSEMALIIVLLFNNPLRKLVILGLDRLKRGRGPVMVKTVAGTVSILLISSVYSAFNVQKGSIDDVSVNPTDQILMANHLLEATLMGASLFLALMIDRLHHYIRDLRIRRKAVEAVKNQGRGYEGDKSGCSVEVKAKEEEEVLNLKSKLKQLEFDIETKTKDVNIAKANTVALRKQSEGFLNEYDRLLEENQNLRNKLQSMD